jgi:hypothetical protein
MIDMAKENKTVNEDMKSELKRMEEPIDAEFEAFKKTAIEGLEAMFNRENFGKPTESDYKLLKILYDRVKSDFSGIRPLGKEPLMSHWDFDAILKGAFKRYAEILEKNLTSEFMSKYRLTHDKISVILVLATSFALSEFLDPHEEIVEAMKSDDPDYRKEVRFEAFMQAHKEKLEPVFKRNKLEPPTIPDYMLLHMVICRFLADTLEGAGNKKVVIPRNSAKGILDRIASDYTNLWKESLDPESIKEHRFTNKKIACIVRYATHHVFGEFIMDDKEVEKLGLQSTNNEI